jgi:hypothetical protein
LKPPDRRMRHPHSARSGKYAAVVRAFIDKKSIGISVPKECCLDPRFESLINDFIPYYPDSVDTVLTCQGVAIA